MAIENSSYRCVSSREATDVVSRSRISAERAAQVQARMSNFDKEVKSRLGFIVAHLLAQRTAMEKAQRGLKALI